MIIPRGENGSLRLRDLNGCLIITPRDSLSRPAFIARFVHQWIILQAKKKLNECLGVSENKGIMAISNKNVPLLTGNYHR